MGYDPDLVQTVSSDDPNDDLLPGAGSVILPVTQPPAVEGSSVSGLKKPKRKRTVAEARDHLYPPATAPVTWSTLRRNLHYGASAAAVRKRLQTVKVFGVKVAVHKLVVAPLFRVERRVRAYEKKRGFVEWNAKRIDCFNWRPVRGGTSLSHHAHAIALDIDPTSNLYHPLYTKDATTDIPEYVIQAFTDEGWTWGGNWNKPLDPQHFQWR